MQSVPDPKHPIVFIFSPKILVAHACSCTFVNSVNNAHIPILQAFKGSVENIESVLACKSDAKYKNVYIPDNIVTSSGLSHVAAFIARSAQLNRVVKVHLHR